ncbi:unnamed protein product [Choristocarpus tenellus]
MQALAGQGNAEVFVGGDMGGGGIGGGRGELLSSLGRLGLALRTELPPGPTAGNVGDYAFGDLSTLIQQLMQADTSRHGSPPAAKEVVANLPTLTIAEVG